MLFNVVWCLGACVWRQSSICGVIGVMICRVFVWCSCDGV